MTDEITPEIFEKLVGLAALELSPEESDYLRNQLNNQLRTVHDLVNIPLSSDIPLASHGVPYPIEISPDLRKDSWQPFTQTREIMAQAPQTEENYFVVPEIPHTSLE